MSRHLALLRRYPLFRRLWVGGTVSQLGDWLSYVAVSLLAIDQGEGALALALVFVAHTVPHVAAAPVAGWLADRLDRRALVVGVNVAQVFVTTAMAVAALMSSLAWVQALLLLRVGLGALELPARGALLRRFVDRQDVLAANAFASATWSAVFSLGTAAGGLLALLGPAWAIALDAVTFAVAALVLSGLPAQPPAERAVPAGRWQTVREDASAAFATLRERPQLAGAVFAKAPLALMGGAGWVVLNLVGAELALFGGAAIGLGALHGLRGVAMGAGPLAAEATIARGADRERTWTWAVLLGGAGVLGLGLAGATSWAALAVLAWGLGSSVNWVLSSADLQVHAPDRVLGRLGAVDDLSQTLASSASALAAGLALDAGAGFTAVAGIAAVSGVASWVALRALTAPAGRSPSWSAS